MEAILPESPWHRALSMRRDPSVWTNLRRTWEGALDKRSASGQYAVSRVPPHFCVVRR